jgi:Rod binding domain-containing protein
VFQRRLDLVEAILVNKFPQLSFEEVRKMLDLKAVNFSETRFYQDVLQKGLEQGLEQGLQRGEADLVLRQLQRRCCCSVNFGESADGSGVSETIGFSRGYTSKLSFPNLVSLTTSYN